MATLYYCGTHRNQTAHAPPQSAENAKLPRCPICYEPMFWVPNGGQVVPPAALELPEKEEA